MREWLKDLDQDDRKVIGEDIKLVQYRWPLGMPVVGKLEPGLWEVRSRLKGGRIARVCFTVHDGERRCYMGSSRRRRKRQSPAWFIDWCIKLYNLRGVEHAHVRVLRTQAAPGGAHSTMNCKARLKQIEPCPIADLEVPRQRRNLWLDK